MAVAAGVTVGGAVVALAMQGMFGTPVTYGLLGTVVAPPASQAAEHHASDGRRARGGPAAAAAASPGGASAGRSADSGAGGGTDSKEGKEGKEADGGKGANAQATSKGARKPEPPEPSKPAPSTNSGLVPGTTDPNDLPAAGPATRGAEPSGASEPTGGDGKDYKADGPSRHTDHQAAEYFRANWGPNDKAVKRLRDIRTVGGYLRIYTDLPESADNSRTAITLCERGLAYLHERGVENPVVFVHSEFGQNGNPVLANIIGPSDRSCRVTYPDPR
ncbi:hypothetical protein WBK31_05435 [Nonomuraea sp. N2-4H]|uniref:hypothetical protein n=1 Tax=Nonomuraea sp. N2-4H TaxID=3128898 RepID=UPI0032451A0B